MTDQMHCDHERDGNLCYRYRESVALGSLKGLKSCPAGTDGYTSCKYDTRNIDPNDAICESCNIEYPLSVYLATKLPDIDWDNHNKILADIMIMVCERCDRDTRSRGPVAFDGLQEKVNELEQSLKFYKDRCDELQRLQLQMRDPERTIVCDILANGGLLPSDLAMGRYDFPVVQQAPAPQHYKPDCELCCEDPVKCMELVRIHDAAIAAQARKDAIYEVLKDLGFSCPGGEVTPICDLCGANKYCIELRSEVRK